MFTQLLIGGVHKLNIFKLDLVVGGVIINSLHILFSLLMPLA